MAFTSLQEFVLHFLIKQNLINFIVLFVIIIVLFLQKVLLGQLN